MNQSCPECNNDGGFCNFCGNKPSEANYCDSMTPEERKQQEEVQKTVVVTSTEGNGTLFVDPYEAIGSNLRVHHPVQPKTQVERWREEWLENWKVIKEHNCGGECDRKGTDNCWARKIKMVEIEKNIAKDHEEKGRFIGRTPTGTFSDDKCNCAEITCKVDCKEKHTHKTFSCEKCKPKVSLLNKIKKLLQ